ncbi:ComEC/Rec2 family competence protein [Pedobacter helvus]|uniref:ComEC/Rec2 family competence protein n=1 Tax=Pedobacter helvus TaxID=2563444 RepID=A0ABW9JM75_9SPHI
MTKFRAFQLDSEGSLFSFYKQNIYTLLEARLPKGGIGVLIDDLGFHGKRRIDTLHITSWDADHCHFEDLSQILNHLRPALIEIPGYEPESDTGKLCKNVILRYDDIHQEFITNVNRISKSYIQQLPFGTAWDETNIFYPSDEQAVCKNDRSLVCLFRSKGFNVLSLGDCESWQIADRLLNCNFIRTEVDVLILPHHGANNGFITTSFLQKVRPKVAICSSNYDNRYDHPRPEVREMLFHTGTRLFTTKTGDVVIYQRTNEWNASVYNMKMDNYGLSSSGEFTPKRWSRY